MTLAEFGEWKPRAVQRYGEQQVQAGNVAADTAQEWAAGEYAKLLPQGLSSPGHHLLIAEQEGQRIGLLWLFTHAGDRPAFVYYVEVDPAIRGQGLGRAVMAAQRGAENSGGAGRSDGIPRRATGLRWSDVDMGARHAGHLLAAPASRATVVHDSR